MDSYIKWMEGLPKWLKVVFCFFILDWFWAIWRICKGVKANSAIQVILAILWIFFGGVILWILDLICIIVRDYPFWWK